MREDMLRVVRSHLTYANMMATGAMFVALGGSAYALNVGADNSGVFHGCVSNRTGALRVVKPRELMREGARPREAPRSRRKLS